MLIFSQICYLLSTKSTYPVSTVIIKISLCFLALYFVLRPSSCITHLIQYIDYARKYNVRQGPLESTFLHLNGVFLQTVNLIFLVRPRLKVWQIFAVRE